jgi:23S rRNA pseudouridine2605 synthase
VASLGAKADPRRDAIKVAGKRVRPPERHRYLLLNKPRGFVTTVSDPEGRPTVLDLVPERLRRGLRPVGRLDFDTEGLLLLTDDGELGQRVAHPRYGCKKTYEVKVKGAPGEASLDRLRHGIPIAGRLTAPSEIRPRPGARRRRRGEESQNTWWMVRLSEGRTRQIREMFLRIGHPVQKLRRVAIGPLRDPRLPVGGIRELTPEEVRRLREASS